MEKLFLLRRKSMGRLIIDGNRVYELDESCLQRKRRNGQLPKDRDVQTAAERERQMKKRARI